MTKPVEPYAKMPGASADDLALEIKRATDALNSAIGRAWEAGLRIEVETMRLERMGRRHARPVLTVEVSKPL